MRADNPFQSEENRDTFITKDNPHQQLAADYSELLLEMKKNRAMELILEAAAEGMPIQNIYLKVLQPVQYELGLLWQRDQISVAQEHYCTSITQLVMSRLYPYIFNGEGEDNNNKTCITTCAGSELHELGIRMVADLLEMEGWDTIHLGANTPSEEIARMAMEQGAELVGISVTISHHLEQAVDLIEIIRDSDNNKSTSIMVGGYLFLKRPGLWQEIGADGYARDGEEALEVAGELVAGGESGEPDNDRQ